MPIFHIAFTAVGAENLRNALRNAGRDERVIGLPDDFRLGPIDVDDPWMRARWIKNELGLTGLDDVAAESEWFWQQARLPGDRPIAWVSRRSAREYTGFLEWLRRRTDDSCEVIDLTDLHLPQFSTQGTVQVPVASLAQIDFEEIRDDDLFERTQTLTAARQDPYRELWRKLRDQNAALRILKDNVLISTPISFFDRELLSQARENWRKVAMIVGMTLNSEMAADVSDLFLAARVEALVASGQLERHGRSAVDMRRCEVRLPQREAVPTGMAGFQGPP